MELVGARGASGWVRLPVQKEQLERGMVSKEWHGEGVNSNSTGMIGLNECCTGWRALLAATCR